MCSDGQYCLMYIENKLINYIALYCMLKFKKNELRVSMRCSVYVMACIT